MTRHIADTRSASGAGKTQAFFEIARREREVHPATMELLRRPRPEGEKERVAAFLRIERGRTA
jgi:hypothetical protein